MRTYPLLFGALLVLGCGGGPKNAPVSGVVKLDGKPLAKASVSFQPTGDGQLNPGPGSTALTDENGAYTLQITGGGQGAVVGKHRVEISCPVDDGQSNPEDDRPRKVRDRVPAQYNVRSTLAFEVRPVENTANFDLKSR